MAGIILAIRANVPAAAQAQLNVLVAAQVSVAVLFWGLWFWSRSAPLPASIVALVVYATLVVLNVVTAMKQLATDPEHSRGLGVGIIDIIIIVVLARAIAAGLKHKRLVAARAQAGV